MLSHACGSCGKALDGASRTYSADLRMWVARCPRCGFAVRWAPRVAREPARVWARLRALNLRLGMTVGTLQIGVIALVFTGGYLDTMLRHGAVPRDLESLIGNYGLALVGAAFAGVQIGAAAALLAPHRRILSSYLVAWALVAGPLFLLSALLLFGEAGPERLWRNADALLSRNLRHPQLAALVLAVALATSAVAAFVIGFGVRRGVALAVRRAARARRETLATARITPMRLPGAHA